MTIINTLKKRFLSLLADQATEFRVFFILTIVTGVISGVIAVVLQKIPQMLFNFLESHSFFSTQSLIIAGSMVLASAIITHRFFPDTSGAGIPGIRIALIVHHGYLSFRSTIAKIFATILSLGSGMSLGREAPTVTISAGFGSALGRLFKLNKRYVKALVVIGASSGLGAAFNTPMAAVIFGLEEIVGDLNSRELMPIIVAAVIASITASTMTGSVSNFAHVEFKLRTARELMMFCGIAVVTSVFAALWIKGILFSRTITNRFFKNYKIILSLVCFGLVMLLSSIHLEVIGNGHDTLQGLILSIIDSRKLLFHTFLIYFLTTTISASSGLSGGLFLPSLVLGAMLGGVVGSYFHEQFPMLTNSSGAYVLIGMGCFFSSVMRTPFTSIVMMFELTRNYELIGAMMIANILAHSISNWLHKGSLYENLSEQSGISLPSKEEENDALEKETVESAMISEVVTLDAHLTVIEAYNLIKKTVYTGFPVIMGEQISGMVSKIDLERHLANKSEKMLLDEICTKDLIKIHPDQNLLIALQKLNKYQISRLPVVSRINTRKLLGLITAEDILRKFDLLKK
jgi:CIC family chloride channel protein